MLGSNFRAFRWVKGSDFEMLGLPGGNNSYEMAINDSGWMAGHTQTRGGYLRANNLGTLDHGLNSFAYGINNTGAVVGSSQAANGESHEFLYQDGVLYDLNLLMGDSSGWQLQWAYDINYEGQIVGSGLYNGEEHAFRLDLRSVANAGAVTFSSYNPMIPGVVGTSAVPEPSTWAMVLAWLALCRMRQIRRN